MPAPGDVIELIERFDRNREAYLSGQYNETQQQTLGKRFHSNWKGKI
jgi:hypothetical protein